MAESPATTLGAPCFRVPSDHSAHSGALDVTSIQMESVSFCPSLDVTSRFNHPELERLPVTEELVPESTPDHW